MLPTIRTIAYIFLPPQTFSGLPGVVRSRLVDPVRITRRAIGFCPADAAAVLGISLSLLDSDSWFAAWFDGLASESIVDQSCANYVYQRRIYTLQ